MRAHQQGTVWWKRLVKWSLIVIALLCVFRYVMLFIQQRCLRDTVTNASRLLNQHNITYWWDFGTMLGLVREKDIIWTETDADLSVLVAGRDKLWEDNAVRIALEHEGFVRVEQRDEVKLRIYDSWGFFLDIDVWDFEDKKDNTEAATEPQLQMVTGRLSKDLYILPVSWVLPVSYVTLSSLSNVPVAIPAQPDPVLKHWYGADYMQPRKFDKGLDASSDPVEVFMWTYAVVLYEIMWSFKLFGRIVVNGFAYHQTGALILGATLSLLLVLVFCWLKNRGTSNSSRQYKWV